MKNIAVILALLFLLGCEAGDTMTGAHSEPTAVKDIVVLETSLGVIEIELDAENAPATAENFLRYVDEGFYDGTIFHRVIGDFMIQGGGFTPDGNQKPTHDPIPLEAGQANRRGTVAMARTTAPNSATSQFFINVVDNSFLDPAPGKDGYAVFGTVVSGMDTADKIKAVRTKSQPMADWPVEPVVIVKVYRKG